MNKCWTDDDCTGNRKCEGAVRRLRACAHYHNERLSHPKNEFCLDRKVSKRGTCAGFSACNAGSKDWDTSIQVDLTKRDAAAARWNEEQERREETRSKEREEKKFGSKPAAKPTPQPSGMGASLFGDDDEDGGGDGLFGDDDDDGEEEHKEELR